MKNKGRDRDMEGKVVVYTGLGAMIIGWLFMTKDLIFNYDQAGEQITGFGVLTLGLAIGVLGLVRLTQSKVIETNKKIKRLDEKINKLKPWLEQNER